MLTDGEGVPFYDENRKLANEVPEIAKFLTELTRSSELSARFCSLLQKFYPIKLWLIKVRTDDGEHMLDTLLKEDEEVFCELPAEAFSETREVGAIRVVYCHLLSIQNLARKNELA